MQLDRQIAAYVVGAIGILAGAAGGYVKITTPEAAECQVQLADKAARLELTERAVAACEKVLDLYSAPIEVKP